MFYLFYDTFRNALLFMELGVYIYIVRYYQV